MSDPDDEIFVRIGVTAATAARSSGRTSWGSRMAIRSTKASVNKTLRQSVNHILDTSLALEKECFGTPYHGGAIEAFAQKRVAK